MNSCATVPLPAPRSKPRASRSGDSSSKSQLARRARPAGSSAGVGVDDLRRQQHRVRRRLAGQADAVLDLGAHHPSHRHAVKATAWTADEAVRRAAGRWRRHRPPRSSRAAPPVTAAARSAHRAGRRCTDPAATSPAAVQSMWVVSDEDDRGHEVHQPGQHVLQPVLALQRLGEEQPQQRHEQHALRGAEVAAVDAGAEHADPQRDGDRLRRAPPARGQPGVEPLAEDDQQQGQHDQRRHDRLERTRRQLEQQQRPEDGADQRGDAERRGCGVRWPASSRR